MLMIIPGLTREDVEDMPYDWWTFAKQIVDKRLERG